MISLCAWLFKVWLCVFVWISELLLEWMLICMLSIKLFTFSAIISLNIFCSFFLFSPSETPMMPMLICLMKPHRSKALFNCLNLFSFCSSDYIISIVLSSNFLILSSVWSNLPFNHIVNFSFWLLYSSAPEIFVHIFLGFPSLYWYFYFVHTLSFFLFSPHLTLVLWASLRELL